VSTLNEIARLVRAELSTLIQPVQLLSVNPVRSSGEVSGRFRSNGMLFDYTIGGGTVRYRPVGSGGRTDAAGPLADARVLALSLLASRRRLDGAVNSARLDGYREVMGFGRMDAGRGKGGAGKGKKNCSKGYGCGSTCIESSKECIKQGGAASQKLAGALKGGGSGGATYKGYQLSPPDNPAYEGKNAEVAKVTKALRNRIGELEPATTRAMIDAADKYGAKLDGLAHRLKAEKSLGRKIENESKGDEFKGNIQAAADSMSDVVRYTMKTTNERYTETAENVIKDFEAAGYTARVKNYWEEGQPYRGMNVALTSPEGLKVELQLHTPQSLYVKHKTHPLYEQYRVETNDRRRRQLFDRMIKITNSLVPPWGTASTSGAARSPQVRSIQQQTAAQRQRLMGIGQRKVLGFQTAQEAGLV
jgi:hypothetical protein